MDLINKTQGSTQQTPGQNTGGMSAQQNTQGAAAPNSDPSVNLDRKLGDIQNILSSYSNYIQTPQSSGTTGGESNHKQEKDMQFFLAEAISLGASDVHITVGYRVIVRVNGVLKNISSTPISESEAVDYVRELLKSRPDLNFNTLRDIDLTYTFNGRRFRVNIFKQKGNYSIVFRIIPAKILTLEELGMPSIIKDFSRFSNGLVLVTGPTGSGKSTTIASLLNLINITQPKHLITLEDPIEYIFPQGLGLVDQREYGIDFNSWPRALRSILRQDPDIVLIGEMRDLETVEAALQIAETGHLVFATLHTNSAATTIDRLVDIFPATKQDQIKVQFASVIRAIVSQKLVKTLDDRRRVASEILIANSAVRNAIRENKGYQIDNIIQTNSEMGMVSLEKSLVNLVREGAITVDTAKLNSTRPSEIDILLNNK